MVPATVAIVDQLSATLREYADGVGIALGEDDVRQATRFVVETILAAGMYAEPDHESVANAYYVAAMAWRDLVA